jgi:hypothetical protein
MIEMHESFAFVEGGRTFRCHVESARRPQSAPQPESWWWFQVSSEDHQRYAPFRAAEDDTADAVRRRVVDYYENLLARRAEPARARWQRGRVAVTPAAAAAPAEGGAAAEVAEVAEVGAAPVEG